jgi:hypothetical protein
MLPVHLVRTLALKKPINFNIELQLGEKESIDSAAVDHRGLVSRERRPPSPLFTMFISDLLNGASNQSNTAPDRRTRAHPPVQFYRRGQTVRRRSLTTDSSHLAKEQGECFRFGHPHSRE